MSASKADLIAALTDEERAEVFAALTAEELDYLQYDGSFWLRPEQQIDDKISHIIALVAGRGFGKTFTTSHWVKQKALEFPECRIALAGRTAADVRDVIVEGPSGILAVHHPDQRPIYKPSIRRIEWANGSQASLLAAESPDQARGPGYHFAVGDEFAAWKMITDDGGATLFSNLIAATRLGKNPQILLATTPKRTAAMKKIMDDSKDPSKKTRIIRGSTFDNTTLSKEYIENFVAQYGDSDLAKQELYGQMLDDAKGLVFDKDMIETNRIYTADPPNLPLRVVAVDPTVAAEPRDECGIIVIGATINREPSKRRAIVLDDASIKAGPDVWAQRVVDTAHKWNTKFILIEKNQGHELLRMAVNAIDPSLQIFLVYAAKGKVLRAEPVVIAMNQGRVKFWDVFPELEDQMQFYDPANSKYSPDRLDAFVWGIIGTIINPPEGLYTARFSTYRPTGKIPTSIAGSGVRDMKFNGR